MQSVNYTALAVEGMCNSIEKSGVPLLVFAPHRIGDQISVLDATCRLGVDEKRNIYQVDDFAVAMAERSEFGS